MAKNYHIVQVGHKLMSTPGTMWDVFLYYNEEYERPYTGYIGRVYKTEYGKYTTNEDRQVFSTKESAANHLFKLNDERSRRSQRDRGTWDVKTHPRRTLKSSETARHRSYENKKTKKGHEVRYKQVK